MAKDETYRESVRRSHKLAALFLSQWAWHRGADCVHIAYAELLAFLSRYRFKSVSLEWFEQDISPSFPHVLKLFAPGRKDGLFYLSRKRFPYNSDEPMKDKERNELLEKSGIKTVAGWLPSETKAIEILARMSAGISDFPTREER